MHAQPIEGPAPGGQERARGRSGGARATPYGGCAPRPDDARGLGATGAQSRQGASSIKAAVKPSESAVAQPISLTRTELAGPGAVSAQVSGDVALSLRVEGAMAAGVTAHEGGQGLGCQRPAEMVALRMCATQGAECRDLLFALDALCHDV